MKKKIFAIALAAGLLVLMIAGTSMAYFTDVEEATNVFTAGNVDITLTYAASTVDSDDVDNGNDILNLEDNNVYPGQEFVRNATITNTGSEAAYVGAIITLTNANGELSNVITPAGDNDNIPVAIKTFFTNLVKDGYTVKYTEITNGYAVYVLKTEALAGKVNNATESAVIFDNIVIPTSWDNTEMAAFSGLNVNVKAYATQTVGFATNDAATALTTAFTDWTAFTGATVLN